MTSIYNTESRCAHTQRQSHWLGSSEDSLCLYKYPHICICSAENMQVLTTSGIIIFFLHWKPSYSIHMHAFTGIHMHAYSHIKDLQLAAGTHTNTLILIQGTQRHFQVLSIERGHKMLFSIRPLMSPEGRTDSHLQNRSSEQQLTQMIYSSQQIKKF